MSTLAQRKMTVDEFLAWSEGREGRWELNDGVPYRMAPERTRHGKVQLALLRAIQRAGAGCHMLPDSSGVRISRHVMHISDALVYCGPELADDVLEVVNPVIVAEVASPSTRVQHYLIVDPEGPPVIHYAWQPDGTPLRSAVHGGILALSPPGLEVGVAELLAPAT
jgi:Uma2 family endonuclease